MVLLGGESCERCAEAGLGTGPLPHAVCTLCHGELVYGSANGKISRRSHCTLVVARGLSLTSILKHDDRVHHYYSATVVRICASSA